MIYIINREGTTIGAISNPIYEGSAGVNTITLFAPYPANTQILITAILPNGVPLRNLYPMSAIIPPTSLKDINGNGYCVFQCVIDENITALTGTVQLFFTVLSGVGKKLNTYTTGFAVSGGNIRIEEIEIPSDSDYIEATLQYLAELNSDPVQSVIYKADNALITPSGVEVFPNYFGGFVSDGFTPQGTTEFIGDDTKTFFAITSLDENERVGFTIDLETVQEVKLLQLFMFSTTVDINITVEYGETLDSMQSITEKINATSYAVKITPRILLNASARYIRVLFDTNVAVQGIQIFEPSNTAEYVITQKSGAQSVIELAVASIAVDSNLSLTSRNPVENRVIAQALQGKQNKLTFDTTPTQGSTNPVTSNGIFLLGQSLRNEIENITVPNIYYESTFQLALSAVAYDPTIKANDIIIITDKGAPDLVVFNSNGQAGVGATVLTQEQIDGGNIPTPQAGDRFIVANTGLGVICLESGIVEPNIVVDNALSATSENPVQNKVITAALNGKQNTIPNLPNTLFGFDAMGNSTNYKIAQDVPGVETDSDAIVNIQILNATVGNIETALDNIITLQNQYINGGTT